MRRPDHGMQQARELQRGRCFIIGEVAQAHDGSLGMAHAFIDAIAASGADAVKFQTHLARAESTPAGPFRIKFSRQDATRYEYWKRMEFTEEQWCGLAEHARDRNLVFLSSPFSVEAVDLLGRVGMPMWKLASGEVGNTILLDRILETRRPVLLSTGMSALDDVDQVVRRAKERGVPFAVLQCTTAYPCPPQKVGLNMITFIRDRYQDLVGLSDPSGTISPGLAAAALGIDVLEVHVTLSREMFGPDVVASVTTSEMRLLVDGVRFIERARASPVDKNAVAKEMAPLRDVFTRSVVARDPLTAGTVLKEEHLAVKKPGTGLPPSALPQLIGRRLRRSIAADEQLRTEDVEG